MPEFQANASRKGQRYSLVVALLFCLIFLVSITIGYRIFRQLVSGEEQQAESTLHRIAEVQTSTISAWVKERLSDAAIFSGGRFLGETIDAWRARGYPEDRTKIELQEQLRALKAVYNYREVAILDTEGNILVSTLDTMLPLDGSARQTVQRAVDTNALQISPIHSSPGAQSGDRLIDIAAPLLNMAGRAHKPTSVLFLRAAANQQIGRFVQPTPLLHSYAGALLAEIDDNRVINMSDSGQSSGFRYREALPLNPATLMEAAQEPNNHFFMVSPQGHEFLVVARKIAGTPWYLLTMVDDEAIHATIHRLGWIVAVSSAGILSLIGTALLFWWKNKEGEFRLQTLEAKTEKRRLQQQYNYLSKYANDLIILTNAEGRIMEINDRPLQALGRNRSDLVGLPVNVLFTTSDRHLWEEALSKLRRQGGAMFEVSWPQPDGTSLPVEINARAVELEGKQYIQLIGRDLTERKESEAALRESRERLNAILESLVDVVWSFSPDMSTINYINRSVEELYDYPASAFLDDPKLLFDVDHPEDREKVEHSMRCLSPERPLADIEHRIVRRDGKIRWVHCRARMILDQNGIPLRIDGVTTDITQRKSAELQVQFLAYYDNVTMLPNRALLNDRLAQATHMALRSRKKVAVLFMDLDNFKNINDSLGHHVGDLLLRAIAERLLQCVREEDTVSRIGGDEFLVLLPDIERGEQAVSVAEKILLATARPFLLQEQEIHTTISVGISIYPDDAIEPHELVRHADAALYQAKAHGRNAYQFFTQELNYQITRSSAIERQLRQAIESGDLCLWYQPQIDTLQGKMIGAEALLRWRHQGRFLSPLEFVPVAEERGLIGTIGEWAMREACRQCRAWQTQGLKPIRMAVNVSPIQFQQSGFAPLVTNILDECGLDPRYLELEITESAIMRRAPQVAELAMKLRDGGVGISIDDFGTGYSSLSYLKHIPIDKIKIDRSFIADMLHDMDDEAITLAIINLAHSLNLRVIAEGVESREQLERLRFFGCNEVQGHYYSAAVPAEKFQELLENIETFSEIPYEG